jgi:hypothetical protein
MNLPKEVSVENVRFCNRSDKEHIAKSGNEGERMELHVQNTIPHISFRMFP